MNFLMKVMISLFNFYILSSIYVILIVEHFYRTGRFERRHTHLGMFLVVFGWDQAIWISFIVVCLIYDFQIPLLSSLSELGRF